MAPQPLTLKRRPAVETPIEQTTGELTGEQLLAAITEKKRRGIFAGENELSIPSAIRELLPEVTADNLAECVEGYAWEGKLTTGGMFRQSTRTTRRDSETGETVPTEYLVCGFSVHDGTTELNPNGRKALAPSGSNEQILKIRPNTPCTYTVRWDANRVVPNSSEKGAWNATLSI